LSDEKVIPACNINGTQTNALTAILLETIKDREDFVIRFYFGGNGNDITLSYVVNFDPTTENQIYNIP
jgi:hypothetical protein